ncbi:hypothetical protein R6Q59_010193 [Mikania micrantha]
MSFQNTSTRSSQRVIIHLEDHNHRESISKRTVHLLPPSFEVKIGRGSQTEPHLHPKESNAWFTSRVMSREHAILKANPHSKRITLEDTRSMHGTYVDGARLGQDRAATIQPSQKIQFGAEIVRGDQTYNPLELDLRVDWSESDLPRPIRMVTDLTQETKNTFSVDYSDEDEASDDEVELIYESIRISSPDSERRATAFSVPDTASDLACVCQVESEPKSPYEANIAEVKKSAFLSDPLTNNNPKLLSANHMDNSAGSSIARVLEVTDIDDDSRDEVPKPASEIVVEAREEIIGSDWSREDDIEHGHSEEKLESSEPETEEGQNAEEEPALTDGDQPWHGMPYLQTRNDGQPRRPSPSDCAMPKPSWYSAGHLPNIQSVVEQLPYTYMYEDSLASPTSTYPALQPLQTVEYCGGVPWSSTDSNGTFASTFAPVFTVPQPAQNLRPVSQGLKTFNVTEATTQPNSQSRTATQDEGNQPNSASKVSITSIIEDCGPEFPVHRTLRKRKSDEMTDSSYSKHTSATGVELPTIEAVAGSIASTNNASSSMSGLSVVLDHLAEDQSTHRSLVASLEKASPSKKTVTFSPETTVIDSNLERPPKRVKIHYNKAENNFYKYVATAMAGAAIGAVGTVIGLAALPAEYFL